MVEQNYDLNLKYDLYTFVFIYIYLCEWDEVANYLWKKSAYVPANFQHFDISSGLVRALA